MILDHEIVSRPSDFIKKAFQTTQHYSEISLVAKVLVCIIQTNFTVKYIGPGLALISIAQWKSVASLVR